MNTVILNILNFLGVSVNEINSPIVNLCVKTLIKYIYYLKPSLQPNFRFWLLILYEIMLALLRSLRSVKKKILFRLVFAPPYKKINQSVALM